MYNCNASEPQMNLNLSFHLEASLFYSWKGFGSFWSVSVVTAGTSRFLEWTICFSKHTTSHLGFHSLLKSRSNGKEYCCFHSLGACRLELKPLRERTNQNTMLTLGSDKFAFSTQSMLNTFGFCFLILFNYVNSDWTHAKFYQQRILFSSSVEKFHVLKLFMNL